MRCSVASLFDAEGGVVTARLETGAVAAGAGVHSGTGAGLDFPVEELEVLGALASPGLLRFFLN